MAKEKIEDVSTPELIKRKRFIKFLVGIFIGVTIVWIGLIIYDYFADGQIRETSIYGLLPTLCCIWIPLMMLGKVKSELGRRDDK
jgi:hypothetical protein